LCDRLPTWEPVIVVGALDELALLNQIASQLDDPAALERLNDHRVPLRNRLRQLFETAWNSERHLFILDDFEQNGERDADGRPRFDADGRLLVLPAALGVLRALLDACLLTNGRQRVLVTCRYSLPRPASAAPWREEPLAELRDAEL